MLLIVGRSTARAPTCTPCGTTGRPLRSRLVVPQLRELWAVAVKCVDETSGFLVVGVPAERGAKVRGVAPGVHLVIVGHESAPLFGHDEPSVDLASGWSGVGGLDAESSIRYRQRSAQIGNHASSEFGLVRRL